jgi:hypothetical protein
LEATVAALTSASSEPVATTQPPKQEQNLTPKRVRVSRSGTAVSDKFHLGAGRYRATVTMTITRVGGFICELLGPGGSREALFNELIKQPQEWTESTAVDVNEAGGYFEYAVQMDHHV